MYLEGGPKEVSGPSSVSHPVPSYPELDDDTYLTPRARLVPSPTL